MGPWSHERDVAPPIGVTTTFEAAEDGHVYSRQSQPTRDRCESVLAALEATPGLPTPHALLYSSGLAACHAIMVALLPTTRRIVVSGGYHGTHQVIDILKELRAELDIIELPTVEDAEALLQPTDLVWLETPRNPMCEVYDIAGYANLSCKPAVVVDGTFAPPPMQRALALGATAVMHSTTKCECATPPSCHPASVPPGQSVMKQRHCLAVVCPDLSGHSDAVGGALCVDDDELAERLRAQRTAIGGVPGSLEVWLLLRSLRTLPLRLERHNTSAILIAAWLQQSIKDSDHPLHGLVERVWHPSLPDHPGHDVAVRQMAPQHFGGVLSVELRSEAAAKALPQAVRCTHPCTHAPTHPRTVVVTCGKKSHWCSQSDPARCVCRHARRTVQLHLFGDATSLGGVESLVEWRRKYDESISPLLLRMSIGLESHVDLQNDLQQAILSTSTSQL